MKEINEKILILTSVLVLCIVLPFNYHRKDSQDQELSQRIKELGVKIESAEGKGFPADEFLPLRRSGDRNIHDVYGDRNIHDVYVSNLLLSGTCFNELHEIERFLVKKLQSDDRQNAFRTFPPLNLRLKSVDNGVEITWSDNPRNQTLIKNLMNNPLMSLKYRLFRWTAAQEPAVLTTLPYGRNSFVDMTTGPVGKEFFYSVMCVFEGQVGQHKTLIESQRSETSSLEVEDRFFMRLLGGAEDRVFVEVTVEKDGNTHTHVFTLEQGQEIGHAMETAEAGTIDYTTTLMITDIQINDETRKETINHPVFNSDGSRTLDPSTDQPVFEELEEMRTVSVYSIECRDPEGNLRIVKES